MLFRNYHEGVPLPSSEEARQCFQRHLVSEPASRLEDNALSAYNVCSELQGSATQKSDVIHARVLGYLLLNAPSFAALDEIINVIHSCSGSPSALSDLGKAFLLHFIRHFLKSKGRRPSSSSHPNRPSFDEDKEELASLINKASTDHRTAKSQALIRDRYQCMITGIYDRGAPESILSQTMRETQPTVHLECAHIVPDSTYFDVEKTKEKRYSASVLAVLKRFGYDVEPIHSNKVHSLLNIMTVSYDVHDAFDRLELWLEATNQVNRYRVFTAPKFLIPGGLPEFIEFTSSYPKLPLPSPDLLALHAVCAKVAHLSGAGEYIEQLDRNVEELCVLAADGQSFYTLEHALMRATPSIIDVGG